MLDDDIRMYDDDRQSHLRVTVVTLELIKDHISNEHDSRLV